MSEELKNKLDKLEAVAGKFPTEETASAGLEKAADFLAGAAAMASALERKKAEA